MTDWHRVADVHEMAEGAVKMVVAGTKLIALTRHGGKYCALENRCPHAGGPLSQGSIENGRLVCPWHGREYDLATGECEGYEGVATYRAEVRADGVFVAT